jgi:hypothetical protein
MHKKQGKKMPITFCYYEEGVGDEHRAEGHLNSITIHEDLDDYVGETLPFRLDTGAIPLDENGGGVLTPTMLIGSVAATPFYYFRIESTNAEGGILTLERKVKRE